MEKDKKRTFLWSSIRILAVLSLCAALLVAGGAPRPAHAGVLPFVVDDPGDAPDDVPGDGVCATAGAVCTLRAAIQESNAWLGADIISFNLTSAPYIITTSSNALPIITEALTINGTSQTGYSSGSPVVQLNGDANPWDGLRIGADNTNIYGLVIRDFGGDGVVITAAGGGVVVRSSHIGTDLAGTAAASNAVGIRITDSPGNLIGGTVVGHENVIAGNAGAGIIVEGAASDGNTIIRNLIGVDAGGNTALGNGDEGILIDAALNTTVGNANTARVNVISGNGASGVRITNGAAGTKLIGNRIGTNYGTTLSLGNGAYGVLVESSSARIGGTSNGTGNFIAHNTNDGVAVTNSAAQVAMLRNTIFDNGGLGIDLADDGVTPNDLGDVDAGENNLQNFPIISSALVGGTNLQLVGGFNSLANETFRLEFFFSDLCDPTGYGEGGRFIKSMNVTTDGNGNYSINTSFTAVVDVGDYITATATLLNGAIPEDTSEASACWPVSAAPTPTPTKTPTPSATSSGGGGGGSTATSSVNTLTPTPWPTPTVTGTPPTNTPIPTWTSNPPQKTLTAMASLIAPTATSTFSSFILTNTPFPSVTFDTGPRTTPSATPTRSRFLTAGEMTATAEREGSLGQIAGFDISTLAMWCIIPVVLLLLGIGGIQLMNWINSRREVGAGGG